MGQGKAGDALLACKCDWRMKGNVYTVRRKKKKKERESNCSTSDRNVQIENM